MRDESEDTTIQPACVDRFCPFFSMTLSSVASEPRPGKSTEQTLSVPSATRFGRVRLRCMEAGAQAYAEGVSLDWKCGVLAEGLACYRNGEFFEAHEHWESVWLASQEPEKSFVQALIQIAAAFHHLRAGNRAGAVSLLRRALRRLELCPARFAGIAVASLCAGVSEWLSATESAVLPVPAAFPPICPIEAAPDRAPGSGLRS